MCISTTFIVDILSQSWIKYKILYKHKHSFNVVRGAFTN